jgi:PAS domain S-box-containing protein
LWEWDLRTGAVYRTANYYELIGIPEEEDTHDFEFFKQTIHPDDLSRVLASIQAHLKGHTSKLDFEYRHMGKLGATGKWLQARARVVERDIKGNAVRLLGTLSDVSSRKAAELAAQQRAVQLQRLLEGATEAFWERDLLSGKVDVSERWEHMLGYGPGELGSATLEALLSMIHPEDVSRAKAAMDAILCGATQDYAVEMRCRTKLGDWIWVLSRGRAVEWGADGKPTKLAGTRTDITEQRELKVQLQLNAEKTVVTGS